jgi:hypothetical protein
VPEQTLAFHHGTSSDLSTSMSSLV